MKVNVLRKCRDVSYGHSEPCWGLGTFIVIPGGTKRAGTFLDRTSFKIKMLIKIFIYRFYCFEVSKVRKTTISVLGFLDSFLISVVA